jgi:hypothetical protein
MSESLFSQVLDASKPAMSVAPFAQRLIRTLGEQVVQRAEDARLAGEVPPIS